MAQIKINTSQNVEIGYSLANLLSRIVAQIIDFAVIISYLFLIFWFLNYLNIFSDVVMYIVFLPVAFYSFLMESLFQGQSVGKMLLKIKVVKLDGTQAGLLSYFIRWIFRFADIFIGNGIIGILLIAASKHSQRLGDLAANTVVVNLNRKQDFKYSIFQSLDDDYQLQFPEVKHLSEEDIKTITDVLKFHDKERSSSSKILLQKTKNAILAKMGTESNMSEHKFLNTIVKDYNYFITYVKDM